MNFRNRGGLFFVLMVLAFVQSKAQSKQDDHLAIACLDEKFANGGFSKAELSKMAHQIDSFVDLQDVDGFRTALNQVHQSLAQAGFFKGSEFLPMELMSCIRQSDRFSEISSVNPLILRNLLLSLSSGAWSQQPSGAMGRIAIIRDDIDFSEDESVFLIQLIVHVALVVGHESEAQKIIREMERSSKYSPRSPRRFGIYEEKVYGPIIGDPDKKPQYPSGMEGMQLFFEKENQIPEELIEKDVLVIVNCSIELDGSIFLSSVVRLGPEIFNQEALRLVRTMHP